MQRFDHSFLAMGGPCRLRIDCDDPAKADHAIGVAEAEVQRLEAKYSRYLSGSLTSEINRRAGGGQAVAIDPETFGLLNYAQTLWQESDGLFDLTSGVLRRAWDFKSSRLPSQAELNQLLPLVDWPGVEWDEQAVLLPHTGLELDFGGCVKEYACDSVARVLQEAGIGNALVDLCGDMVAMSNAVRGQPWQIGIRHPGDSDRAIAQIPLSNAGLASSGNYERYMVVEGRRYGHILNPQSGWPVQGLACVSVVADQCLVAGSSATIAMLKPEKEALKWLDSLGLPWLAVDAQFKSYGTFN
jgi:thiamine biosynthesis lipoprotein